MTMFTPEDLAQRYPWLNLTVLQVQPLERVMRLVRSLVTVELFSQESLSLGVEYVHANCETFKSRTIVLWVLKCRNLTFRNEYVICAHVVNAVGPHAR